MLLYRVGATKFAGDLTGEGAKINGGRWNHPGISCIYSGVSRALVLLEYSAHVSIHNIKRALSITTFSAPDDAGITLKTADLPGNWKAFPHPKETRDLGSALLTSHASLIIQIPSVIIEEEHIFLINPGHPRAGEIKVLDITDYAYDIRVKG